MIKISASTLPGMENLKKYMDKISKTRVDMIHCDVMDGKFVKNESFSPDDIDTIKEATNKKIDVHLMIEDVDKELNNYIEKDVNFITIHYESFSDKRELLKTISLIKLYGIKVGLSIKPATDIDEINDMLSFLDLVLLMSVEPGEGGQEFIDSVFEKIKKLNKLRKDKRNKFIIQVDGGVNKSNIGKVKKMGADFVVIGNALFGSKNLKREVKQLKKK